MVPSWDQLTVCALLVGLVLVLLKALSSVRGKSERVKLPPCLPWLPVVGSLPFIGKLENFGMHFMQESKRRGKVFAFYAGSRYTIVLNGWDTIHQAFVKNGQTFADRSQLSVETNYSNPHSKGMVAHPYNDQFVKMRRTSMALLKDLGFGRRYVETRIGVELEILVDKIRKLDGRPFDPSDMLYQCNNGIIMSFMFGRQFDYDNDPLMQQIKVFITVAIEAINPELDLFPILRHAPRYKRMIDKLVRYQRSLFSLLDNYIEHCIQNDEESFVNSYVKLFGPQHDAEQLNYLIRDLLLAGSETTMTTLRWALIYLANHPDWQKRLQSQIDYVFDESTSGRRPTLEDISRLTYVEATITELMRLETVVPLSVPRRVLDDTEIDGFFIPKGTMVIPNLYGAHMDPEVWHEPTEFRPERFIDSNGCIVGKERVIPFSIGKRSCFGEVLARQELFLIITRLVQLFDISPPEGQSRIDFKRFCGGVVRPDPYSVRLTPRSPIHPVPNKDSSETLYLPIPDVMQTQFAL